MGLRPTQANERLLLPLFLLSVPNRIVILTVAKQSGRICGSLYPDVRAFVANQPQVSIARPGGPGGRVGGLLYLKQRGTS
jgi:hypothetical protein